MIDFKLRLVLLVVGLSLVTIIVLPIAFTYKHMSGILEMDHPSLSIEHSIKKNLFIDTLFIMHPDTIRVNHFKDTFDLLPTSVWTEKKTYWKSKKMDMDSLAFLADTVELLVNFQCYKEGKQWKRSHGFFINNFYSINSGKQSVYIDSEMAQLAIKMNVSQLKDTVVITAPYGQQLSLKRSR